MRNFIRYSIILSISIAVVSISLYVFSAGKTMKSNCLSCHENIYLKGIENFYPHSPFVNKKCATCHLGQENMVSERDEVVISKEIAAPSIFSSYSYLKENNVLVENLILEATYDINIIVEDRPGHTLEKKYTGIIPARLQDAMADDRDPPLISGITAGPIKKAAFLETTIAWNTDEPSTSCVEYGFSDQYGQCTSEDIALSKHHIVNLHDLTSGKTYHFRVKSRDISGNEAVSEDYVFNTTSLQALDVAATKYKEKKAEELAITSELIFLFGSKLGLYIEATNPAKVTVECLKVKEAALTSETELLTSPTASADAQKSANGQHTPLVTKEELTIKGCYRCHPSEILGVSHPVGIAVKMGTNVPDYLPTLEGGVITCVTCHEVHGGNRKHFTRMDAAKDLCNTCHKEY
ncbi:MAG: cytochrome c3 family protein [Desulfobacterales bacterium]